MLWDSKKIEKVKKIWKENRGKKALGRIFFDDMKDILDTRIVNPKTSRRSNDWYMLLRLKRTWEMEEETKKREEEIKNLDDGKILEIQEVNRKRIILLLRDMLEKYERNPDFFQKLDAKAVSKFYQIITNAEEAAKRTELSKKRLGLEAVKTFLLPYNRYTPEQLQNLKQVLNENIDRILQRRLGGAGQNPADSG